VLVWKGFCIVHQAFKAEMVNEIRRRFPEAKIIVHPETPKEVVRLADAHGSTSQIIRYVEDAPAGSLIVVGTELNLIQRLAEEHRDRGVTVKALAPSVCANMARTNEANLLALLEAWPADRIVRVEAGVAADARKALERMLAL
jgi:quinolinate synthase